MIVTMGTMIGFIMLGGIVVNNAIILIDSVNCMISEKKMRSLRAIVTVGQKRMRPIMMTTLTTVLGLLPMALDDSESSEFWAPLAVTVISGLLSATFLTLFVVPCVYIIFDEGTFLLRRLWSRVRGRKLISTT
jgi:HAE1 family hydrophobic/amphiphilic exporter-1